MKKLNNSIFPSIVLGLATSAAFGLAPAGAQTIVLPEPTYPPIDGARAVLDNCGRLRPGQICDPNADRIQQFPPGNGLAGRVDMRSFGSPGGIRLEGTVFTDSNGNPLPNIDFLPPVGGPNGQTIPITLQSNSDFAAFDGWKGTISDLYRFGFDNGGSPFPSDRNPRVQNFISVSQRSSWSAGNGVVDGVQLGGFGMDLVYTGFPIYTQVGRSTKVSFPWELQAYKLDTNGNRLEDQSRLPGNRVAPYANKVEGAISTTFAGLTPRQVKARFDQPGEFLENGTYNIALVSRPITLVFPADTSPSAQVPEPTTILSSLLLFGAGALKLRRRG